MLRYLPPLNLPEKMKSAKSKFSPTAEVGQVDAFMAGLKHPLKSDIEVVRTIICGAGPGIEEAIKWNAPSYRTKEFFATFNLRAVDRVQLIFHLGAKVRPDHPELKISDPANLIKWLASDRCLVTLGAGNDIRAKKAALQNLVREWIAYV